MNIASTLMWISVYSPLPDPQLISTSRISLSLSQALLFLGAFLKIIGAAGKMLEKEYSKAVYVVTNTALSLWLGLTSPSFKDAL